MQRRDIVGYLTIPYNAWSSSQVFEHETRTPNITHDSPPMVRNHQNLPIVGRRMTS